MTTPNDEKVLNAILNPNTPFGEHAQEDDGIASSNLNPFYKLFST